MPDVELPSGVRIHYEERGARDARPVVLAHGFGVSLDMWWPQGDLAHEYRLILWDAPGHGQSSTPDNMDEYTMPALARDLRGLLEAIGAVDGAVIGGMSFGGQIALQYAADYTADTYALILSDTTTRDPDERTDLAAARGEFEGTGDPGLAGCRHAMRTRPTLADRLPYLQIPTLVIAGTEDLLIVPGLHRLVDSLPNRRVMRLAGCTHGTSGQRPDEWTTAVFFFLDDVKSGHPLGQDETM